MKNPPKPTQDPSMQFTKQLVEKRKELLYDKTLPKDKAEGSSAFYRFDILAQLANIPARITLYELLEYLSQQEKLLEKV